MRPTGRIKGIVFDFDGLIIDSEEHNLRWWRGLCDEHGCPWDESFWLSMVDGSSQTFDAWGYLEANSSRAVDRESIRARERALDAALIASPERMPLLPGVAEYLDTARRLGLRLAVASNSRREWVEGVLAHRDVADHFAYLSCRADDVRPKPHPDLYLRALAGLGLDASKAIAFEDSPHGVAAAKAAGLYCIAVPTALTGHLPVDQADLRISSLAEMSLETLIERIEG